jgi:hypothetical protein
MPGPDELDAYLPAHLRDWIEQTYYARVNAQASFDFFIRDPAFLHDPLNHLAFYSDHGVVHVRDVATQMLRVVEAINGVLIPPRPPARINRFMEGCGVAVTYLHDVGMSDFSPFGRAMHPEFAAQVVFDPALDHLVDALWEENCGDIAWRLLNLTRSRSSSCGRCRP